MKHMFRVQVEMTAFVVADDKQSARLVEIEQDGSDVSTFATEVSTLAGIPKHWHDCLPFGGGADQRTVDQFMAEIEDAQRLVDVAARELEAQIALPLTRDEDLCGALLNGFAPVVTE